MRLFLVSLSSFVLLASGQMMAGPIMMNGDSSMSMMKVADMAMMNGEVESKSQCQNFCEKTYPPHTFDNQPNLLKSCSLGCQLFSLTELVDKDDNVTVLQDKCDGDCLLAYPKDETMKSACQKGCNNQLPGVSHGNVQIVMDNPNQPFLDKVNSMMDSVSGMMFGQMGKLMDKMMSRFQSIDINPRNIFQFPVNLRDLDQDSDVIRNKFDSFFKKSPLTDFLAHMGPGLAMPQEENKESPKFVENTDKSQLKGPSTNPLFSYANSLNSRGDATGVPDSVGGRKVAKLGAEQDETAKPVGNKGPNGRPIILVQMLPVRIETGASKMSFFTDNSFIDSDNSDGSLELRPHEPSPPILNTRDRSDEDTTDPDNTWIACLARQTGRLSIVSRWLLMLAMMLCIVSMMWICVTIIRTAPKRRLRQQMMVEGDREYLVVCGPEEKKPIPYFVETPAYEPNGPAVLLVPPMEGAPPPYVHSPSKKGPADA